LLYNTRDRYDFMARRGHLAEENRGAESWKRSGYCPGLQSRSWGIQVQTLAAILEQQIHVL
jgi:hypothetical protein